MTGRSRYIRRVRAIDHRMWGRRQAMRRTVLAVFQRAIEAARAGNYVLLDTWPERARLAGRLAAAVYDRPDQRPVKCP